MIGVMRRVLSGVGRTLITAGVLLLLFVAYQLWGTGIRQAQQQTKLKKSFAAALAADGIIPIDIKNVGSAPLGTVPESALDTTAPPPSSLPPTSAPSNTVITPSSLVTAVTSTTLPQVRAGRSQMKAPKPGRKLGLLVIPRINKREVIVEGTATADLQTGPGRYTSTAYPGQPGNVGIAGHRTTYGAPFFNLNLLRIGDPIFIQTQQGNFRYDVIDGCQPKCLGQGWFVVSPQNKTVLAATPGQNLLTLTTCHPQYSARQRLVVRARLVGTAAAADFFEPPATTVAPTTEPSSTSAAPTSAPPAEDIFGDSPTVAADTAVAETDTSASTVVEPGDGDALSLQSARDPHGRGPVWKLSWLQGHRSTWIETGLLSALCAAIWAGFWFVARRRRLWAQFAIYGAGFFLVFLPALYFTFERVARLLPENL